MLREVVRYQAEKNTYLLECGHQLLFGVVRTKWINRAGVERQVVFCGLCRQEGFVSGTGQPEIVEPATNGDAVEDKTVKEVQDAPDKILPFAADESSTVVLLVDADAVKADAAKMTFWEGIRRHLVDTTALAESYRDQIFAKGQTVLVNIYADKDPIIGVVRRSFGTIIKGGLIVDVNIRYGQYISVVSCRPIADDVQSIAVDVPWERIVGPVR